MDVEDYGTLACNAQDAGSIVDNEGSHNISGGINTASAEPKSDHHVG